MLYKAGGYFYPVKVFPKTEAIWRNDNNFLEEVQAKDPFFVLKIYEKACKFHSDGYEFFDILEIITMDGVIGFVVNVDGKHKPLI